MFHTKQLDQFIQDQIAGRFVNNSPVAVVERSPLPCFRCIGVHHLTGAENQGGHRVLFDVLDDVAQRAEFEKIQWGWRGQRPDELSRPILLDKPANQPMGDAPLFRDMYLWAQVFGKPSDLVSGLTSMLPDGEPGNTWGHHSHYVVWMWVDAPTADDPPPDDDPLTAAALWRARYEALAGQVLEIAEGIDRTYR